MSYRASRSFHGTGWWKARGCGWLGTPGGLAVQPIISHEAVAARKPLEPEQLLQDIAMDMEPEDGCLSILGLGDVSTVALHRRASKTSKSFSPTAKTERHRRCVAQPTPHRGTRRRLTFDAGIAGKQQGVRGRMRGA
jgi:hypothetical protein